MHIRTRIASGGISVESGISPTKDRPHSTNESVWFELLPTDERDHLDLDTGEVFQDYGYARLHKKEGKLIGARITIRPTQDQSYYRYNRMIYIEASDYDDYHYPSSIHFDVFVAPEVFRDLTANIRNRFFPAKIAISLKDDPSQFFTTPESKDRKPLIEMGWEPDGSGMIWHNAEIENRKVSIESVTFDYEAVKARYDDNHRLLPLNASENGLEEQTAQTNTRHAEIIKYLSWATMGIFALAIMAVIFIVRQR